MSRSKTIKLSAINIALHPHKPKDYADLWEQLFKMRRAVDIGRDQALMIGAIDPIDKDDPTAGYMGLLYRFTVIDTTRGWFDIESGEEADADTVRREVKIPAKLRPNLSEFLYRLFPKSHRLVVEQKNPQGEHLGPAGVEKMLLHLVSDKRIVGRFESIDITIEQSKEKIEDIITGRVLKSLEITVKRPNPDDDSDADEKAVLGELIEEKLRSKTIDLKALPGQSIQPSERTKRFARVAASNGRIKAVEEKEGGRRVEVSSKQHPKFDQVPYSDKTQDRTSAFLSGAREFVRKIVGDNRASPDPDESQSNPVI